MELVGASTKRNFEVVTDHDVWQLNLELLPHSHERALKEEVIVNCIKTHNEPAISPN